VSSSRSADRALGLLLGCHPLPCVAVVAFATAYAAAIGAEVSRLALIAVTVLAGQLVVGWSNDAIDAPRDIAAGRSDKPVSTGLVTGRTLALAALLAAIVCVALSFRLGAAAGRLHLVAVVSAVGYNAGLKVTRLSPLPYVISFGLLPVVVTLAVIGPPGRAPLSQVVAAALLGAAAHAGNTVGDTEADAATGVRGLPQRLGPQRSLVAMAGLVAGAAIVLLVTVLVDGEGSAGRRAVAVTLLLAGVVLAAFGAVRRVGVATPPSGGRDAWRLTLAAVALVVIGFLVAV
jgi:4-hydroxybenzoate polyprenyltransferase